MTMKTKLFTFLFLGLLSLQLRAQVTIGSGTAPAKAAILDLKTKEGPNGGATTDANGGGLLLPRVALVSMASLAPFDDTQKLEHKGLIVYNISETGGFTAGVYSWDGAKWTTGSSSSTPVNSWNLAGNIVNPNTDFIGSTNEAGHILFKTGDFYSGLLMTGGSRSTLNTAFGTGALNLSGVDYAINIYHNTAIGARALSGNLGSFNTAIGAEAAFSLGFGNNNTAIGASSLRESKSGSNNVAIGFESLVANKTGNYNVGVGSYSGNNLTSGSNNIIIGANQQALSATGSNQLNIGGAIFGTELTGDVSAPAGNIGIGTSAPAPSAILDLTSANKGFLMPRVALTSATDVTTILSPATGLLVYNTANSGSGNNAVKANKVYYYNGTVWDLLVKADDMDSEDSGSTIRKNQYFGTLPLDTKTVTAGIVEVRITTYGSSQDRFQPQVRLVSKPDTDVDITFLCEKVWNSGGVEGSGDEFAFTTSDPNASSYYNKWRNIGNGQLVTNEKNLITFCVPGTTDLYQITCYVSKNSSTSTQKLFNLIVEKF